MQIEPLLRFNPGQFFPLLPPSETVWVMAWPCISRVCCLARFWNQFDKSDLSVPLTIQNYSDIAEQEVKSVTKQVPADRIARGNYSTPDPRGSPQAPVDGAGTRESLRGRREPSYKPREDYQPPGVPFPSVTQYKQDFKPWPIPRKENFPWISNGGSGADGGVPDSPINSYPHAGHSQGVRGEKEERGKGQKWGEQQETGTAKTSSYRQEYRAWTGVRPAKSTRKTLPAPYVSPESNATHFPPETSYQAAYSGEAHRSTGVHQGNHLPNTSTTVPPASVPQPITTPLQAGGTGSNICLQQSNLAERADFSITKGEEQLVRTKLPPNPSAVFQSGPRVFNI
ncbi:microtubule-associated protein 6 homolog isoform X2 [Lampris incognitus]|uniref:microtubule-associated protein 6 homolog isoform X2 n=1 Tax=Lampris incognitus TaxID=2546036 RepID=UPI0024B5B3FB|nr:microtubule-associated protein 6 homolog isoform X2 [Lampris incognitus]